MSEQTAPTNNPSCPHMHEAGNLAFRWKILAQDFSWPPDNTIRTEISPEIEPHFGPRLLELEKQSFNQLVDETSTAYRAYWDRKRAIRNQIRNEMRQAAQAEADGNSANVSQPATSASPTANHQPSQYQ
ncbi:hypothetical protein CspHIS471_0310940 [Cutaneotrichosporon sp. HIS471]|nr:hypothetical protein CspHIS471_0310940 [Cutaneotrichosporon sp. HIS471]